MFLLLVFELRKINSFKRLLILLQILFITLLFSNTIHVKTKNNSQNYFD